MAWHMRKSGSKREDGVVALEFVVLFPLLMLILLGIMEFGRLFYVRQTLTNATREAARAAVMLNSASDRITWAKTTATTTINNYLGLNTGQTKRLPGVTLDPYDIEVSGNTTGSTVLVKLSATDVTLVLGSLVDALKNLSVSAQTTMIME